MTPARPRTGHAASGGSSTGIADDSDAESVKSYGSACSTASACDHATFAFNGTTWSGRSRKYVVHCSNHNGDNEQYLTPTQRAARQVRKFQVRNKLLPPFLCMHSVFISEKNGSLISSSRKHCNLFHLYIYVYRVGQANFLPKNKLKM